MGFVNPYFRSQRGMGGSRFTAAGNVAAIGAIPVVGIPLALTKLNKLEGGSGQAARMGKFMSAWNGAKRQVVAAIGRVEPQVKTASSGLRKLKIALAQLQKDSENTDNPDVQDAVTVFADSVNQIDQAADLIVSADEDVAYKVQAILDGEATGDILAGQPANVYLNDLKASVPELEAGVREVNSRIKIAEKLLRNASDLVKKDSERRKIEAAAMTQAEERLRRETEAEERAQRLAEQRAERERQLQEIRDRQTQRATSMGARPMSPSAMEAVEMERGPEKGIFQSLFGWLFG